MGSTTNAIFTGGSQFSADFQNVITRAVNIASLPITQLNNQKTTLTSQSTALSSLDASFVVLQSAVAGIANAFGGSSLQASISDTSKVSVALGSTAAEGTYSINVTNAGVYATSITASNWDASAGPVYKLSLNGAPLDLSASDNSAASVAAAINSQYGSQVRATVVNVGGSDTSPDYRLSLQANQFGNLDPQVLQDGVSITDQGNRVTGTLAQYTINNSNNAVTSSSRTVSLGSGMTASLLGGTGNVSITVARPASALSNALSAFATAYNAAVDGVAKQRGSVGGALAGDQTVAQLSQVIQNLGTYGGQPGVVDGLKTLGLDVGSDGHMTFNLSSFTTLYNGNAADVGSFFGSATTGGFLKTATDALNSVEQTDTGLLPTAKASIQNQITSTTNQIDTQQARVDQLQAQLQKQMAASDALISSMEQKYNFISGMFQAMQTAAQQFR
jgi:flagellar hook-associated protein 2